MSAKEGYELRERSTGDVAIFHHGRLAKLVRGADAKALLTAVNAKDADAQAVMAEAAGSTTHGQRPGTGPQGPGGGMSAGGAAHGHKEFRRKSGSA